MEEEEVDFWRRGARGGVRHVIGSDRVQPAYKRCRTLCGAVIQQLRSRFYCTVDILQYEYGFLLLYLLAVLCWGCRVLQDLHRIFGEDVR
jgi:hypothetical protein